MILTYRFRIKDRGCRKRLERHARAVNFVWNYLCETQRHAQKWRRRWPSHYDFTTLCIGASREIGLLSDSIGEISRMFVSARDKNGRCPRFRSNKNSLGWIPIKGRAIQLIPGGIRYLGRAIYYWDSRALPSKPKTLSLSQDARGRWYVNFQCEVDEAPARDGASIGVDLGLKDLAVLSDGERIENPRVYRGLEAKLAIAQRARNKVRVRAIHAKIANTRRDFLHKQTTRLVLTYATIIVGNVSAAKLKQTSMAKAVSDASWSTLRSFLRYKAIKHGGTFIEADERWTSATCSDCGAVSGPKGRKGLRVREWECSACGSVHDRDKNAAINILAVGTERGPRFGGIAA